MKDQDIMEMLSEDISDVEVPPISDKVLRALHDKAENKSEKSVHHTAFGKKHKHFLIKLMFAAMLAFFVLSVPIIIVITNKDPVVTTPSTDNSFYSNESVIDDEPSAVNSIVNPEKKKGALDIIKERKTYGPVSLTSKSRKELESLLLTFNEETQVYEDDNFIYNFDPDGILIEMINKKSSSKVTEFASLGIIKQKSEDLFNLYYSERTINEYDNTIVENENILPKWVADFKKNSETIRMTFDGNGELQMLMMISGVGDSGIISKKQAVEIALEELQSGKYNIPEFKARDVDITIEMSQYNSRMCYCVLVSEISYKREIQKYAIVMIDTQNGEIINIEY